MDQLLSATSQFILPVIVFWHDGKMYFEGVSDISHDALHIIIGVILWLVIAMLLRRPITSWLPWLSVLILLIMNEIVDLRVEQWDDVRLQYAESVKDLVLTMLIPSVLMALARLNAKLFKPLA